MVRLIVTDFPSKEENEAFYIDNEFDPIVQLFTYYKFKKHSVYLSKYDVSEKIYSLNIVSMKYLRKNQFLVYLEDEKFVILFNHKTIYSAKINQNFMADDIVKSILTTKHITMLSGGGSIDRIYYIVNSKYNSALENLLKQNTRNEKNEVIAQEVGEINRIVAPLNELDSTKMYIGKVFYSIFFIAFIVWSIFFGIQWLTKDLFFEETLNTLKRELNIEKRLVKRQEILLKKTRNVYQKEFECISK